MQHNRIGARLRASLTVAALAALAVAAATAVPWSGVRAGTASTYSIDFHRVSSAGGAMRGNCVRLAGTAGQEAPGYSSGNTISIIAGFWAAAPTSGQDQMFFSGFEGC